MKKPLWLANEIISSISQEMPDIWTTITPLVLSVIAAAILSAVMFPVILSTSTNIGVAFNSSTACAVATCVCAGIITSSPIRISIAMRERCNPAVQFDRITACLHPVSLQNSSSNLEEYLP